MQEQDIDKVCSNNASVELSKILRDMQDEYKLAQRVAIFS